MNFTKTSICIIASIFSFTILISQTTEPSLRVNYNYSPGWWQTTINLPQSPRKSLIGKAGQLLYEYPVSVSDPKTQTAGFSTSISFSAGDNEVWKSQKLYKAEIPLVITHKECKGLIIKEESFAVAPLLFGANDSTFKDFLGTSLSRKISGQPGNDILIVTIENKGNATVSLNPSLRINSIYPVNVDTSKGKAFISDFLRVVIPYSIVKSSNEPVRKINNEKTRNQTIITLKTLQLDAGEKVQLAFGVSQGYTAIDCPNNLQQALRLQKQSISWWENLNLPYNKIIVPDPEIQNLLNASVRNIYQSIDNENNSLIINTGPSSNRQFFVSDAPFIMDALTMLNQTEDVKKAIDYMLSLQKKDGSFQQIDKDWKETGMVLWSVANYARLTGDKQWLETVWSQLEKSYTFLMDLRNSTLENTKSPYSGLLPPGNGVENQAIDYVNNYWALAGLNSAITAARWVSRNGQAIKWQSQYDDYYRTFLESVKQNMKKDSYGNMYLPARSTNDKKVIPQKSQWSFLNAVYPGKIFDLNNPLLTGNMKMLERSTKEGLVTNSGWMNNAIVLATASDYAHSLQWIGNAQNAVNVMYAMANHAAPNFTWFEQQLLKESKDTLVAGDMPNSRVSAEFIRLVRHLIVIERGYELHLLEGVPGAWTKPGMEISLTNVLTDFGPLDFKLKISDDRTKATIDMNLNSNSRRPPQRILLHLDGIAGNPATLELELKPNLHKVLTLE